MISTSFILFTATYNVVGRINSPADAVAANLAASKVVKSNVPVVAETDTDEEEFNYDGSYDVVSEDAAQQWGKADIIDNADKVVLHYFNIGGRAELIRLLLAYVGTEYTEMNVDIGSPEHIALRAKAGTGEAPFGQYPLLDLSVSNDPVTDRKVRLSQTDAIMRVLGAKNFLYGSENYNIFEMSEIDSFISGTGDLINKYVALLLAEKFDDETKEKYASQHVDVEGMTQYIGGAHLKFLENFLLRNNPSLNLNENSEYLSLTVTGGAVSIADFYLFYITDLHHRLFPSKLEQSYPTLMLFHKLFSNKMSESLTTYLNSAARRERSVMPYSRG